MSKPTSLTQVIISLVEQYPNDADLGKEVRKLITDIYDNSHKPLGESKVSEIVNAIYGD